MTRHSAAAAKTPPARESGVDWNVPLVPAMLAFLMPMLLSNAIQGANTTVASILVGRYIGIEAFAAVSAFFPIFVLATSFVFGFAGGSSVLVGQAYGSGRVERVRAIAGTTLTTVVLLGVALCLVGLFFAEELLRFIDMPENVLEQTVAFAKVGFLSIPPTFILLIYSGFLRGMGDSKTPFWFLAANSVLTILFIPVLMFGWVGLPPLELMGAAWALGLAALFTVVIMMAYLRWIRHPLQFDKAMASRLPIRWEFLEPTLRIGIPSSVHMILIALAEMALVTFVNGFGSNATAAFGAYFQIANYIQMPAVSLAATVSIYGAQAIGAGRGDRLGAVVRSGITLNFLVGGTLILLAYVFARFYIGWFLTDAESLAIAHRLVQMTLWSYLLFGCTGVFNAIMRSSGVVFWPTVLMVSCVWLVEVPVAYVMSRWIGLEGVWFGYIAGFVVALLLSYGYYRLFWRGRHFEALV